MSEQTRRKGDDGEEQFGGSPEEAGRKKFQAGERVRDGRKAMAEYEVQARATRAKTERLKALRLAKEAQAQTEERAPKRRPARREK